MKATTWSEPHTRLSHVQVSFDALEANEFGRRVYDRAVEMAARELADYVIHHFGQEIAAKLDMQAIANLTVADASTEMKRVIHGDLKAINRSLAQLNEPVYERGLFGVRRIR